MGRPRKRANIWTMRRRLSRPTIGLTVGLALVLVGVVVSGPAGAARAAVTVRIDNVTTAEGGPIGSDHMISIPVTLSEPSPVDVDVSWKTEGVTAYEGDYLGASATLRFSPGETAKTIDLLIYGGITPEENEYFYVVITGVANATAERDRATVVILNDDQPPPPQEGEVNVIPTTGNDQCIAVVGGSGCTRLVAGQQIDIEDVAYINPKGGKVVIRSTAGIGTFYGGRFDVADIGEGTKPILQVRLVGGSIAAKCRGANRVAAGLSGEAKTKPIRRLWGKGKGKFRTRGRYSSGTVRGTNWVTTDYCDGTETRVVNGVVQVYDLVLKKFIILKAGQTYFAKAGTISS